MSRMHTRSLIGSILGIENEDGEAVLDGEAADALPVEELTTEGTEGEAVVTLVEAEGEIEEIATEVDTMSENVEALEALATDLRAAIQDGGLTPQSAVFFQHAHAAIAGRHFAVSGRTSANESFGSASRRLQMTKDAHEGIIDTIKAFIKGIIAFVKKMVKKVVDWFKNLFDTKLRLKKRFQALEKAVANMGSELKDRSGKLDLSSGLTLGGRVPTGAALATSFGAMSKSSTEFNGMVAELSKDVTGIVDKLTDAVNNRKAPVFPVDNIGLSSTGFDTSILSAMQSGDVVGAELPGSKIIVVTAPTPAVSKSDMSVGAKMSLIGYRLADIRKGLKTDAKLEIKPLASGECLTIINAGMTFFDKKAVGSGDSFAKLTDAANDSLEQLDKALDKAERDASDTNREDDAKNASAIRAMAAATQNVVSNVSSNMIKIESYMLQRFQLGGNLIAASIKAYK